VLVQRLDHGLLLVAVGWSLWWTGPQSVPGLVKDVLYVTLVSSNRIEDLQESW